MVCAPAFSPLPSKIPQEIVEHFLVDPGHAPSFEISTPLHVMLGNNLAMPEKMSNKERVSKMSPEIAEHKAQVLLDEEKAGRLAKGEPEKILDEQLYKEKYPEFRAALLQKLKELGRVPQDKE
jgi:hypothetical protein